MTLVEIGVASSILFVVLAAGLGMMSSGARLFRRGILAARGPEAALLALNHLERDLVQAIQIPGDPRPPVVIGEDGEVAFYKASSQATGPNSVIGEPVIWKLEPAGGEGLFHPVRNGRVLETVVVSGWDLQLLEPSADEDRPYWFVVIDVTFANEDAPDQVYETSRAVPLIQPSTNFLHFPGFGGTMLDEAVRLLPWPEGEDLDPRLAPPVAVEE